MTAVIIVPKIIFGYRDDIGLILRGLSELFFQINIASKMVLFVWRIEKFEQMLVVLRKWFKKTLSSDIDSEESKAFIQCNRTNDRISKKYFIRLFTIASLFSVTPYMFSTFVYMTFDRENSTEPIEFLTQMEQEFYGLSIRTNFLHYSIFSLCSTLVYYSGAYTIFAEASSYYCSNKCCSQMFSVISLRIAKLASVKKSEQKDELNDIVAMHVDALKCVKLLDENSMFASLMQVSNCLLIWSSMGIYLTYNFGYGALNLLMLFSIVTVETYVRCLLGEELSQKSFDVQQAVYDFPWYEAPVSIRKSLLRMMQRAQTQVGVTVGGYCFLDIELFGSVTQKSYSTYVVMKNCL
ncbi:odorant receptor 4-like [Armigeres subalbatus]|uniref:odorant receptor 4-like n=1 Tax=Armigeres subalbatus TaxID=124917 RepID=UPI002ED0971B